MRGGGGGGQITSSAVNVSGVYQNAKASSLPCSFAGKIQIHSIWFTAMKSVRRYWAIMLQARLNEWMNECENLLPNSRFPAFTIIRENKIHHKITKLVKGSNKISKLVKVGPIIQNIKYLHWIRISYKVHWIFKASIKGCKYLHWFTKVSKLWLFYA